jgi:hypothetical protein
MVSTVHGEYGYCTSFEYLQQLLQATYLEEQAMARSALAGQQTTCRRSSGAQHLQQRQRLLGKLGRALDSRFIGT